LISLEAVSTDAPRYVLIDIDVPEEGARVGLYEGDDDRPVVLVADLSPDVAVAAAKALSTAYVMTRDERPMTERVEFAVFFRDGDEGISARDLDDAVGYIARAVAHGHDRADYDIRSRKVWTAKTPFSKIENTREI
jgi:hypothetical protein